MFKEDQIMKKVLLLFMVMGILVFSLSLGYNAYAEEKPIKIGFIADFTGPLTEHGIAGKQGAILAMEEANNKVDGRPVELIIEDEASDPAVAMDKARKLVETDKVSMILGPFHGGCAGAVSGYVNRVQIPQMTYWYSIANAVMAKAKWSWAPFGTLSAVSYPSGAYAYEKMGYRTVTTMGTDYVAGRQFVGGAVTAFKDREGKIIQEQWIPLGTKDISSYITVLKDADALFAWFMGVTVIPGLRQLREYKVEMPIIMPQSGHSTHPKIMAQMGDTCLGITTTDLVAWTIDTPENKKFVAAYQKRWKELPGGLSYGGYTGVQIALEVMKKTGGDTSPSAIAKALDGLDFRGLLGTIRFGDARVGTANFVTYKHVKVNDQIVPEVLGTSTVATKWAGKKLVHSLVSKSW
jgi:branched-chain amino acid transport system substrate-binding protein